MNYRQIWEKANGSIPYDDEGRPYEIHHIDGNRSNNNLDNLMCISIIDHLKIHQEQGDIGACIAIRMRLEQDLSTLSVLASEWSKESNRKRLLNGTHNFTTEEHRANNKRIQKDLISRGQHHFCKGQDVRGKQSYVKKFDLWVSCSDTDFITLLKNYKWLIVRKLRDGRQQTKLNSMIVQAINTRYGNDVDQKNLLIKQLEDFHNVNETYRW